MEISHIKESLTSRRIKSRERSSRLLYLNEKRYTENSTPILPYFPHKDQKFFMRNEKFEEKLYLPQIKKQNFILDPKIKSQLRLIQENIRPSFSKYFEKFIEMPPIAEGKKTLVLDLDETLIHSFAKLGTMSESNGEKFFFKVRPHVKELLDYASKKFELIVFTASTQDYADVVLNKLDPNHQIFKMRLYRESCINTPIGPVKDLRILKNRNLRDIILVDNNLISQAYQLENAIPIYSWYGDVLDTELVKLTGFLKLLEKVSDVRNVLKSTFNLSFSQSIVQL